MSLRGRRTWQSFVVYSQPIQFSKMATQATAKIKSKSIEKLYEKHTLPFFNYHISFLPTRT